MWKWLKYTLVLLLVLLISGFLWVTYDQADNLVHHPLEKRTFSEKTPEQFGLGIKREEPKHY